MQPAQWREERGTFRVALLLSLLLAVPAIVRAERLPIKIYTTDDGLAHERVRNVIRDSRGFLFGRRAMKGASRRSLGGASLLLQLREASQGVEIRIRD